MKDKDYQVIFKCCADSARFDIFLFILDEIINLKFKIPNQMKYFKIGSK